MSLQINIFLLLFGGLQGLLLSFFLIRKKAYRGAYAFLVIYIGVMILQIILKVMSKVWLMEHLQPLYNLSYQFPYLYGPLVYLLTLHLLNAERKPRLVNAIHFIPFGLAVVVMMIDMASHDRPLFSYVVFLDGRANTWIQLLSVVVYHVLALLAWSKDDAIMRNRFSNLHAIQAKWLQHFIVISLAVCLIITCAIYFMYLYYPSLSNLKWMFVALSLFIYWISFEAIHQPELFSVMRGGESMERAPVLEPKLVVHRPGRRYHNSGLNEEEAKRIATSLQKLITDEKPFLDPEITIDQLSQRVSCSRHHLSQVLNESHRQSFYDFINQLRVSEAKTLLSKPELRPAKIASLAFDSGFNSISTFNEVFKKLAGVTPSQYRGKKGEESLKMDNKSLSTS